MKTSSRALILVVASVFSTLVSTPNSFAAEPSAAIAVTKKTDLFNGKDLSGWTFCLRSNTEPSKTWSVTNGVMHCNGQPNGYVRTEQNYRDYKLTVEWRFVKVAPRADNSGILIHTQMPDQIWPKCIEAQGQYQRQGTIFLLGGATSQGHETPQTRQVPTTEPQNEKPAGEWNIYEIVAAGDQLKVSVNGKLMNQISGCSITSGAIAIQSEGAEWEVRKVVLEPVSP